MQHNNVYERIHRVLTWKRILAFNVILFLVTVVPLSVRLAQQDTENRSSAAQNEPLPSVTPPPSYPAQPPTIERVTEWFGKKGDTVVILGNNFGEYQWGSKVYVGNVEASPENIVRWGDSVLEVQIPEGARTGRVWVVVNGQQAVWEGSLLLTDVSRSAQIEITKTSETTGAVSVTNGAGIVRGMIEFAHISEPVTAQAVNGQIEAQSQGADSFGKKTRVEFGLSGQLNSPKSAILTVSYPGIGKLEILRTELYDSNGNLIPVYASPTSISIN